MYLPMLPKISSVAYNYKNLSGVKTSGFDKPEYFNIFSVTAVTAPIGGFTAEENAQLFNNAIVDIGKQFDTMFGVDKHRIIAASGFGSNWVHNFYVSVPLITSDNADSRYVVNTIGRIFDRHTWVITCSGIILKRVNGSEVCSHLMDELKVAQWSYLPYDDIVH